MPENCTRRKSGPSPSPASERIHRFIVKHDDGCWDWTGSTSNGYGVLGDGVRASRTVYAHRLAWQMASDAPIPGGMFVLHTCDNRRCTRNDEGGVYVIRGITRPRFGHLWVGTHADNMADMQDKGRTGDGRHIGEDHGRAILTEAIVREIRRVAPTCGSMADLARQHGVTKEAVYAVVKRKTWKHVP